MTRRRQTEAQAVIYDTSGDQERKLGDRRRLDAVVVLTVNDVDPMVEYIMYFIVVREIRVSGFWGEYGRKAET
jgi:hypothetical protein